MNNTDYEFDDDFEFEDELEEEFEDSEEDEDYEFEDSEEDGDYEFEGDDLDEDEDYEFEDEDLDLLENTIDSSSTTGNFETNYSEIPTSCYKILELLSGATKQPLKTLAERLFVVTYEEIYPEDERLRERDRKFFLELEGTLDSTPYDKLLNLWVTGLKAQRQEGGVASYLPLCVALTRLVGQATDNDEMSLLDLESNNQTEDSLLDDLFEYLDAGNVIAGNEDMYAGVDTSVVESVLNEILIVYSELFAPCYKNRPDGILTPNGLLTYNKATNSLEYGTVGGLYMRKLFSFLSRYLGGINVSDTMDSIGMDTTYVPTFQALCAFGLITDENGNSYQEKVWSKCKKYVKNILRGVIIDSLKSCKDSELMKTQQALKTIFTSCFLVHTFDRTTSFLMNFKYDCVAEHRLKGLGDAIAKAAGGEDGGIFAVSSGTGELISSTKKRAGVYSINYIFDRESFERKTDFTYRALEQTIEAGGRIDSANIVLGKGMDGADISVNLLSDTAVSTGIFATTRVGKGVATLGILSSLLANGHPIYYADYKPDMSAVLWDLEATTGARMLAIDSKENRSDTGAVPARRYPFGWNKPNSCEELENKELSILPYIKLLQLSSLLATCRTNGIIKKDKKAFFILDESNMACSQYNDLISKVESLKAKTRPKGKDLPSEAYKYYVKLGDMLENLSSSVADVLKTTGGKGLVGYIVIGQDPDPAQWKGGYWKQDWKLHPFGNMVGNTHMKLLGRGAGTSKMYGISGQVYPGSGLLNMPDSKGYFAKCEGVSCEGKTPTCFKSYLTLNSNDYESNSGGFVRNMLSNLPASVADKVLAEDVYTNGVLNDRIGFVGLIKYIADACGTKPAELQAGYDLMWEVMEVCGLSEKYNSIEAYLYDCSYASLFTKAQLESMGVDSAEEIVVDEGKFEKGKISVPVSSVVARGGQDSVPVQGRNPISPRERQGKAAPTSAGAGVGAGGGVGVGVGASIGAGGPLSYRTENQSMGVSPNIESPRPASGYSAKNSYTNVLQTPKNRELSASGDMTPTKIMLAFKNMSEVIYENILLAYGDSSRVRTFEILSANTLVINQSYFVPKFETQDICMLPVDIRADVEDGRVADLFIMSQVYNFKNLELLKICSVTLAEDRVKADLGLRPKDSWALVFRRLKYLKLLMIEDTIIFPDDLENANYKSSPEYKSYEFQEKLTSALNRPKTSLSKVANFYKNEKIPFPVKVAGSVAGVGAMYGVATLIGAWAVPLGLLVGHKLRKNKKKGNTK